MGFRLQTHFHLFFEDQALDGLEVTMGRMSVLQALELDKVRYREVKTVAETEKQVKQLADILGEHLVSWNLEDKSGLPVPCDAKGILSQQDDLIPILIRAYVQAVSGVPAPLGLSSSGGDSSDQGLSIPMEPLSESPSS